MAHDGSNGNHSPGISERSIMSISYPNGIEVPESDVSAKSEQTEFHGRSSTEFSEFGNGGMISPGIETHDLAALSRAPLTVRIVWRSLSWRPFQNYLALLS